MIYLSSFRPSYRFRFPSLSAKGARRADAFLFANGATGFNPLHNSLAVQTFTSTGLLAIASFLITSSAMSVAVPGRRVYQLHFRAFLIPNFLIRDAPPIACCGNNVKFNNAVMHIFLACSNRLYTIIHSQFTVTNRCLCFF